MARKFQEDVDKLLECSVCLDQIKQPKMLNCQHSFCFEPCLKGLVKTRMVNQQEQKYIQCAMCRKRSDIQDLKNLSDNLYLKNLLEIRKNRENGTNTYISYMCSQILFFII